MLRTKTILVFLTIVLPVAASFCIHQVHTEKKWGLESEINRPSHFENVEKKFCFNGCDCYYPKDEHIVGCNYVGCVEQNVVKTESHTWWSYFKNSN